MSDDPSNHHAAEIRVAGHIFRWEPPDTGFLVYSGDVDGPIAATLDEQTRKITATKPYVFLLVNVRNVGTVTSDARKISAAGAHGIAFRGTAVIGASKHVRVMATLVTRATEIMTRNNQNLTRFFETEAEAREWIAARRTSLGLDSPLAKAAGGEDRPTGSPRLR